MTAYRLMTEPEANGIVQMVDGAGNVVYRLARAQGTDVRAAGLALCEDRLWDEAAAQF